MSSQVAESILSRWPSRLGGVVQTYSWQWQGQELTVVYEILGEGKPVLLLPAFSTVSTRAELAELAAKLATQFQAIVLDWPGFGDSDRPRLDYGPDFYHHFLKDFVHNRFGEPIAVVATGHAAGYVMPLATQGFWSQVVLVAPTWRGPLAVMGAPKGVRKGLRELVRSHFLGKALYRLNTRPAFLKWMYRRHVFLDEAKLTPTFIEQRYENTQQSGARYAPAAFVTGGLDPAVTRDQFLAPFKSISVPLMVVIGEQAPAASKAEMDAIAALPNVDVVRTVGTLGMAEEYGEKIAEAILPFLQVSTNCP